MTTVTRYTVAIDNIRQHDGLLVWDERTVDAVPYDEYLALEQEREQLKKELLAWKHTAKNQDCLEQEMDEIRKELEIAHKDASMKFVELRKRAGDCDEHMQDQVRIVNKYNQLRQAAQQAAQALEDILNDDMSDIRQSLVQQSFYARAALANVGIRPTDTHGGNPA